MATEAPASPGTLEEQAAQLEALRTQFIASAKERLAEIDKEREGLVKSLAAAGEKEEAGNGASPAPRQRRTRAANGNRAEQFKKLVSENPGITVSEVAKTMGIEPNYLYRIAKTVLDKGEVVREGRGYKVAA